MLPKSWKHWCKKYGFVAHSRYKNEKPQWARYSLKGHGHYWRVNDQGMFQCGDSYEEFDRWALCENIYEAPIPQTEKEFADFVKNAKKEKANVLRNKWNKTCTRLEVFQEVIAGLQLSEPVKNSPEHTEWLTEYQEIRNELISLHYERIAIVQQMSKEKNYLV